MSEITPTREADFDAEFPYVLFDYYQDLVAAGEATKEEAIRLYLADMATRDSGAEEPLV